jgi:hypothetical protein
LFVRQSRAEERSPTRTPVDVTWEGAVGIGCSARTGENTFYKGLKRTVLHRPKENVLHRG